VLLSTPDPTTSAIAAASCGASWTPVSSVPTKNINGLEALSSTNIWSAGIEFGSPEPTFVSHSNDGESWSRVNSPDRSDSDTGLNKVTFIGPNDGWALGYAGDFVSETPP